ncbi:MULTISPECIES: SAM-dependent methyltransferase [Bradyrhizobium]|uniref:SAM-dependent methyltransferase n=1 Tax=Bradyrhizobium TaxID=374 RepID=UPI0030D1B851
MISGASTVTRWNRSVTRKWFGCRTSNGDVARALEVGGAAFAFTEMLGPHCQRITVQDVMPQD